MGRALIETLASLVEHRIEAEKDGKGQEKRQEKRQEKGKAAERPAVRSKGLRVMGLRATAQSQLSAGDTGRASLQRENLIAESEMLEQVTECVPRMAGACAVFCCVELHA